MRNLFFYCALFISFCSAAQTDFLADTVIRMDEVRIEAYAYRRALADVPAAVSYIKTQDIQRFNNASILPVMNTLPGVRMEQRSPGSYRISIRGSTLRSPFGVRNIKTYWNNLPFTDAGGNTYINLIDAESIQSMEVIKGPGSSLYGAGTGGVLLINPLRASERTLSVGLLRGSYGLFRAQAGLNYNFAGTDLSLQAGYQSADGYREQTEMQRGQLSLFGKTQLSDFSQLDYVIFYTDLAYQIPGGLTLAEAEANPRQARPAAGISPGAVEQKSALYNKTLYGGINHRLIVSDKVVTRSGLYGSFTDFENPVIRNYEIKTEQNFGGRTDTGILLGSRNQNTIHIGGEFQYGFTPTTTYQNNQGFVGSVLEDDELSQLQYFIFAQAEHVFNNDWYLTLGGSLNFLRSSFIRLNEPQPEKEVRSFEPILSPRIALLKKVNQHHNIYTQIGRGFSPPTIGELRPSEGTFNRSLEAEQGWNTELGIKGNIEPTRINYDLTFYYFRLNESIVIRRTFDGAEFFDNAGGTNQRGMELYADWHPFGRQSFLSQSRVWNALSWQHYRFRQYIKTDQDFSGNMLTGSPEWVYTCGLDLQTNYGHYINVTANYVSEIPLDDANQNFADAYFLLGARLGVRTSQAEVFAGIDNAMDVFFSSGPDLNAFGQRFYNPTAGRNFYFGLRVKMGLKNLRINAQ